MGGGEIVGNGEGAAGGFPEEDAGLGGESLETGGGEGKEEGGGTCGCAEGDL